MTKTLTLAFFLVLGLAFTSCGDNSTDSAGTDPAPAVTTPVNPAAPIAPATPAAAATSGVEHYTCPNGHVGSGGSAQGQCSNCGAELDHNQAFHANDATTTPAATNPTSPIIQQPATPSAAQNAAGVFHYTCSQGCAGGSGSKGNCGSCGSELAHNQAFHN
jgi:hypothetical protein